MRRVLDKSSDPELGRESLIQSLRQGGPHDQAVSADTIPFLDSRARVLAAGEDTDERFDLVEMRAVPAGSMPPLHVHHEHDEGFYVLEGSVTLYVPGDAVELGVGDYFVAPRGIPHTYASATPTRAGSTRPARRACERFVAGVGDARRHRTPRRSPRQPRPRSTSRSSARPARCRVRRRGQTPRLTSESGTGSDPVPNAPGV